jgi:hypothetical protein
VLQERQHQERLKGKLSKIRREWIKVRKGKERKFVPEAPLKETGTTPKLTARGRTKPPAARPRELECYLQGELVIVMQTQTLTKMMTWVRFTNL